MRCGFLKFRFTFGGLVETICLDEDFEGLENFETVLWSSVETLLFSDLGWQSLFRGKKSPTPFLSSKKVEDYKTNHIRDTNSNLLNQLCKYLK